MLFSLWFRCWTVAEITFNPLTIMQVLVLSVMLKISTTAILAFDSIVQELWFLNKCYCCMYLSHSSWLNISKMPLLWCKLISTIGTLRPHCLRSFCCSLCGLFLAFFSAFFVKQFYSYSTQSAKRFEISPSRASRKGSLTRVAKWTLLMFLLLLYDDLLPGG